MGEFIGDKLDYFYWFTASMLILATGIIVGGLLSVLALSYFVFASDQVSSSYDKYEITSSTSQLVGMGLWSFYILIVVAVASIAVMGGLKMMSKR